MLAGRPVELQTADTGGNPAQARTKTQELVERFNVHCLIGPLAAFEALAIDDYIRSSKTPILTVAGAEDMTQRKPNPWLVRPSSTSAQPSHPLGDYAAKDLKLNRVAVLADDFAFGHENVAGFQRVFEDNGGKVVQKLFTPLNAPGVKVICRTSYEMTAQVMGTPFDYPLSSRIDENDADVGHEATVSKIGDEQLFYLQSRGLDEEEASKMIVNGFIEPVTKELPMEYAVELNRLIELQMEGSIG